MCEMYDCNGFILSSKFLPDIALENLLACVPVENILKLREVCQVWRDIISRRTFWKNVAERNGIEWKSIPNHIKEKERGWIVCYSACKNKIFHKNYILNNCGHDQFTHWQKIEDKGDRMIVESPPIGIDQLPADPNYVDMIDSAFVFSYDWGILQQTLDLKKVGLTKEIIRTMLPFQFISTQMIGARFDCVARFCVCLCLLDEKGEAILFNMSDNVVQARENWMKSRCTLNVGQDFERLGEARYLAILICGSDAPHWAGHYGIKCTRISVNLKCLTPGDTVSPHTNNVQHPQNAHVFTASFWNNLLPHRSRGRCPFNHRARN